MRRLLLLSLAAATVLAALLLLLRDDDLRRPVDPVATTTAARPDPAPPSPVVELDAPTESRAEARAPEPVAAPPEPAEPVAAVAPAAGVRGRFLLPDGGPAAGVSLRLIGWQANQERVIRHGLPADWKNLEGVTGAEGRFVFEFEPWPAFQYAIDATLAGFAGVEWRWSELPPGEFTDVGDVVLLRSGTIRGRVVDSEGRPATGDWRVYGEATSQTATGGNDSTRVSAAVDPQTSRFEFEGLPPGPVELSAHSRIANWIHGPTVEVRAGEATEIDLVYRGPDNSRRIVVVTFLDPLYVFNDPAPGSIVLLGAGAERVATKIRGSSQSWSFEDLDPGVYTVEIRDPLFRPWSRSGVATGTAVEAHLEGNAAVALTVVDSKDAPIDDYRLRMRFHGASFSPDEFELRERGAALPPGGVYRGLIAGGIPRRMEFERPDGIDRSAFDAKAFDRPTPGSFTLRVEADGFGPGEARVDGLGIGETREVRIRLEPPTNVVGRITGAEPELLAGVSVVLVDASLGDEEALEYVEGVWSSGEAEGMRAEERTDDRGRFEFADLLPGSYFVVARFHHDFHSAPHPVSVAAGERREIEIPVPVHGAIEGRVVASPDELRNGWVEAIGEGLYDPFAGGWTAFDGEPPPRARVGEDGRFRLPLLESNTYVLSLRLSKRPLPKQPKNWHAPDGIRLGSVVVTAPETATAEFDLTPRRPGVLHATVTLDGEPAAGTPVLARAVVGDPPQALSERATTGPDGRARFDRVQPGTWSIRVTSGEMLWSCTSSPVELASGGEASLVLDIVRHRGRLRVLDRETSQPRSGAKVRWKHEGGSIQVETDRDGAIELSLPAGVYELEIGESSATVEWTSSGPVPEDVLL